MCFDLSGCDMTSCLPASAPACDDGRGNAK